MYNLKNLRRLRWVVLVVVAFGIGSSVAMNVLHAPANLPARFVSTVPPIAVFGALELMTRIPSSGRGMSAVRIFGATIVAGGAATISYAQQMAAIIDLGFPHWQARVWPSIIDGFMVVASISLVEVVRKIRDMETAAHPGQRQARHEDEDPRALEYRRAVEEAKMTERLRRQPNIPVLSGNGSTSS